MFKWLLKAKKNQFKCNHPRISFGFDSCCRVDDSGYDFCLEQCSLGWSSL